MTVSWNLSLLLVVVVVVAVECISIDCVDPCCVIVIDVIFVAVVRCTLQDDMDWEMHWVDVVVAELADVDSYDIVGIFRNAVLPMSCLLVVVGVGGGVVVVVDNDEPSLLAD